MARTEFAKAQYYFENRDESIGILVLATLAQRYGRAQYRGFSDEGNIIERLWEASEIAGLVKAHGPDTIENAILGAFEAVERRPDEDGVNRGPPMLGKIRPPSSGGDGFTAIC
ncbi:hypothetical protein [Bradyrhizobium sp. JYMT SZCCT0180]|uniref:hypothetical protein n=1 Tax=Bradyrhizobium sp. JYMT SZCCT0180 TaxID=2807666 RepID=UPI001BA88B79|nr:hypothetical protein [Bradyrhizobium sp. JYMT SZCCT0180]MBR1213969.1 hypothetical protein [Bradyrhizobium sp. JYMT SZCCT0180]